MGDFRKLPGLLLIGLAAAVLIYPVLHEMGHVLTTVLWGGRVCSCNCGRLPVCCAAFRPSIRTGR